MPDTRPAPAPPAAGPGPAGPLRRVAGRIRRVAARLRRTTVRPAGPDAVRVSGGFPRIGLPGLPGRSGLAGRPGSRRYRLDDPRAGHAVRSGTLRLVLPDPAVLARLVTSGLLTGEVSGLRLRLAAAPGWLLHGLRPPPLGRTCRRFRWHRRGTGLVVGFDWSRPREVPQALADGLASVLRARPWDQASGPVYALDRGAWLDRGGSWPQGRLAAAAPRPERDAQGRPLGAYLPAEPPARPLPPPIVTAVANPYGRTLAGAATRYRLVLGGRPPVLRDPAGRPVLRWDPAGAPESAGRRGSLAEGHGGLARYAVAQVELPEPGGGAEPGRDPAGGDPVGAAADLGRYADLLRTLAAGGMVFAAPEAAVRAALEALGLVAVADPAEVADLPGYALSVAASRRALVAGDAALRRTALAGDGAMPLPAVSVLLASMRGTDLDTCLDHLAGQAYPALEVVVGLHGYDAPEATRQRWRAALPFPLRVRSFPAELPLGALLGQLSRAADGELVTKVDDDDHYGRHHVTDLVLARHTSGADVVAKGARFVYLPERDETIDRAWAAPEIFDVTPAGGAMLLGRADLTRVGGWSHSSKHVDTDLLVRVRAAGGLVYRTHAMEYVYVRHTAGHTFVTPTERLLAHGERSYPGLPDGIIRPREPATAPPDAAGRPTRGPG